MKKLILLSLLFWGVRASAQQQTTAVSEQFQSTNTCFGISVSSSPAYDVVTVNYSTWSLTATTSNAYYRYVAVQNLDSSNDINCGPNSDVSATSTSGSVGLQLAKGSPGALAVFTLVPGNKWYCKTQSTTGTTRAVVCRGR